MASLWPESQGSGVSYISSPPPKAWREARRRRLVVLGSTGSIGTSALDVAEKNPDAIEILGLACARRVERLAEQAKRHRPPLLAALDRDSAERLSALLPAGYDPEILVGPEGYEALAGHERADTVLSAQSGSAGLKGTLAACLAGKVCCLANKESLVQAGDLVRLLCRSTGASLLPVDSEHFALFDCLAGRAGEADHLILTASGGPFRGWSAEALERATPAQALRHPNWNMGAKVTIDSASLMNKALELMEACQLYGLPPERVEVLVHPQPVVHSLAVFRDGSQLAQLATPDMRLPIGACLLWPGAQRPLAAPLDLARVGRLDFEEVDAELFPAVELAREALSQRGGACVALNAADEAAVALFLQGRCGFRDITRAVARALERHEARSAGPEGPLSLSGSPDACPDLRKACREAVAAIEALAADTAAFVAKNFAKGGPSCS